MCHDFIGTDHRRPLGGGAGRMQTAERFADGTENRLFRLQLREAAVTLR